MADDLVDLLALLPEKPEEALAEPRFNTSEFLSRLLQRIDEIRLIDPQAAVEPARFAIRIAARHSNSLFGRSWGAWASVQRALANYPAAEMGHRIAGLYLEEPIDLARFFRRKAYLLCDQGRVEEAKQEIGRAMSIHHAAGDLHARGCALVDLGFVLFAEKNYNEAALRISEALRHIQPEASPTYHSAAVHNLAVALSRCDKPGAQLEVLLREVRQQRYSPGTLPWAKHRWLEGLVFLRRGRFERAELTLRAARNLLVKLGAVHDAGLVTMDMAELFLATGDWEKSSRLAREMFPLFRSLGVDRDAVAALRLYMQAAVGRRLTQAQIQHVRAAFRKHGRAQPPRP